MNPRPRKQLDTKTYEGRFAERLKMLRIKAKLTPEEVAKTLGVVSMTIYRWEAAQTSPHVSQYPQIASIFGLKKTKDILPNE